jgi:tetratricopeptide (TPR) repeat protein
MSRYDKPVTPGELSPDAIQNEVERILASDKFARSKRLRSLLRFTVAQTLQGNADTLKEYVIGTEVLKKPDSYDPRSDSLVRVLASRLRVKLKEYYHDGGSDDPLVIEFPKGKYVPRFQRREHLQSEVERKLRARNAHSRGKFLAHRFTPQALSESAQHFQDAIESDPAWPLPHAELSRVYALQAWLGLRRPREIWPLVRAEADAALQLDEMSSEAHLTLAAANAFFEWRWRDAESHFVKAIERDTYSGAGHVWRALSTMIPMGQISAAQQELKTAGELAASPFQEQAAALVLYFSEQYAELLQKAETDQESTWMQWLRGCARAAQGRPAEAIPLLERLERDLPDSARIQSTLGYLYGVSGNSEGNRNVLANLRARRERGEWIGNYEMALVETGAGNAGEALTLLHEAQREREPWIAFLSADPRLSALRSHPKFTAMVRRIAVNETEASRSAAI